MIYFRSDYSQGAHPKVLEALAATNLEHSDGYGLDPHCEHAAALVRELAEAPDAAVHFMVGGTPCNVTLIAAALRPYETVVAPRSGHAYFHETGAVEGTGHRVAAFEGKDGKLTPEMIDRAWDEFQDEHTPLPRLAYVSQPTEIGTLYAAAEMRALSAKCRERDMLLYVDGARMACALTADGTDLTLPELARLADAFYLGGTKNGALLGEALVITNPAIDDHFRWMIKRQCGMLAKGRILGVQFEALLEGGKESLFFQLGAHANRLAAKLRDGLATLGVDFLGTSRTNQVFPILPIGVARALEEDFSFYEWAPEQDGLVPVRFVTGWGTTDDEVDALLARVHELLADSRG